MKVSVLKRLLERLHFDAAHGSYSILLWPGPVKYRVEICLEEYIVLIPR
ncbi:MAG TPA: hypothetical protein VFP82_03090 [Chthoniobacterales bacterium]|nr:hypothetical protein [Chthoniobacterales bacterium]